MDPDIKVLYYSLELSESVSEYSLSPGSKGALVGG